MTARLRVGWVSDIGRRRENNEDAVGVALDSEDRPCAGTVRAVFVVADGMGGHAHGEVASRLAVDTVLARVAPGTAVTEAPSVVVREAVLAAHSAIRSVAASNGGTGMGTTAIAGAVVDDVLALAHVGDSRAYLVRRDEICQLTEDHAWAAEQVRRGAMTSDDAASHPMRHYLTRSLGQQDALDIDVVVHDPFQDGDVLVVCTDGLTSHVTDDEILASLHGSPSPDDAARRLAELANARGGSDNISVLILEHGRLGRSRALARAYGFGVAPRRRPRSRHIGLAALLVVAALVTMASVAYHRGWWTRPENKKAATPAATSLGGIK